MSRLRDRALGLGMLLLLLGLWEGACRGLGLPPYLLPPPSRVGAAILALAPELLLHGSVTLGEMVLGILLGLGAALLVGGLLFALPWAERAVLPLLVATQAAPVFALAPLLVVWFGFGMGPKVALTALVVFFPVALGFLQGLRHRDRGREELLRLMGAGRVARFRAFHFPGALPSLMGGLKTGVCVAPIGAVLGEWCGASRGLGFLMLQANARLATDRVFAALAVLVVLGTGLYGAVDRLERRLVWWTRPEGRARWLRERERTDGR